MVLEQLAYDEESSANTMRESPDIRTTGAARSHAGQLPIARGARPDRGAAA